MPTYNRIQGFHQRSQREHLSPHPRPTLGMRIIILKISFSYFQFVNKAENYTIDTANLKIILRKITKISKSIRANTAGYKKEYDKLGLVANEAIKKPNATEIKLVGIYTNMHTTTPENELEQSIQQYSPKNIPRINTQINDRYFNLKTCEIKNRR